jgi:GNAT superfamily N-acetyltransferase
MQEHVDQIPRAAELASVWTLCAADVPGTAALLARAFSDNPCYAYMHPPVQSRARDLQAFFERNLRWRIVLGLTWVACLRGGQIIGTLTLEPPGGVTRSAGELLSHWVLPTLAEQGLTTLRRIKRTDSEFRSRYRDLCGTERYWHVHAVAVDPAHQGGGVGSTLLAHAMSELARLRAETPAPVMLSTQRERNLFFYRRFGFELMHQAKLGVERDSPGYTSWFMRLVRS